MLFNVGPLFAFSVPIFIFPNELLCQEQRGHLSGSILVVEGALYISSSAPASKSTIDLSSIRSSAETRGQARWLAIGSNAEQLPLRSQIEQHHLLAHVNQCKPCHRLPQAPGWLY